MISWRTTKTTTQLFKPTCLICDEMYSRLPVRAMSSNNSSQLEKENQSHSKNSELTPQLLKLANETDSILHNRIEDMPLQDITTPETKQIVANMIYSIRPQQLQAANAPFGKAAGMAANQWSIKKRIFLFCPAGSDRDIRVIFNPTYKPITSLPHATEFGGEGCFSVPLAYGVVERYSKIEVSYVDEQGMEHRNEELSGWEARVWQHETDHLDGILYSNRQSGRENGPNCTTLHRFQAKDELELYRK